MEGACIGVYMKERLDDSSREILKIYEKYVIEDTPLFLIAPEWHQIPTYTEYERQQLIEVFGQFPEQVIWIFGECDRIFVAT
jgi:histone acetyltransferase (RNA polymerase elongator complex component)